MLRFADQPRLNDRDKKLLIELYHKQSDKFPTIEMLKKMRQETGLGIGDIKHFIESYIREEYNFKGEFPKVSIMRKNIPYKVTTEDGKEKTVYDGRYACVTGIVIAVEKDTSYVLANRRGPGCPDYVNCWNMPCGYMDAGSAEENVSREVFEETGLKLSPDKFSFVGVSDTGKERNVTLRYGCIIMDGRKGVLTPEQLKDLGGEKDEVAEVKWINIKFIDKYKWAFNHDNVIHQFLADLELFQRMYVDRLNPKSK